MFQLFNMRGRRVELEKRTSELATLKAENDDLKARLEKLERSIGTLVVKAE